MWMRQGCRPRPARAAAPGGGSGCCAAAACSSPARWVSPAAGRSRPPAASAAEGRPGVGRGEPGSGDRQDRGRAGRRHGDHDRRSGQPDARAVHRHEGSEGRRCGDPEVGDPPGRLRPVDLGQGRRAPRASTRTPSTVDQLELSRQFILARYTQNKLVNEAAAPGDDEIQQYYEDNLDRFRQPARAAVQIVLVPTRGEAEALRRRAAAGEDFADLARRYSKDEASAASGGDLGSVGQNSIVTGFSARLPAHQRRDLRHAGGPAHAGDRDPSGVLLLPRQRADRGRGPRLSTTCGRAS